MKLVGSILYEISKFNIIWNQLVQYYMKLVGSILYEIIRFNIIWN